MKGATHKARLEGNVVTFFKVEERIPGDYLADALVRDDETASETTGSVCWSHGVTPEDAVRSFYQRGAVLEVVPADEPFRAELMEVWRGHLQGRQTALANLLKEMQGVPAGSVERVTKNGSFVDALNELERQVEIARDQATKAGDLLVSANQMHQEIMADGDAWAAYYRASPSLDRAGLESARARFRDGFDLRVAKGRHRLKS